MKITHDQLPEFETFLTDRGYKRYTQEQKLSDFQFFKNFERDEDKRGGYLIGFLFYDYSKYAQLDPETKKNIGIQCEFMIGRNDHVDRFDVSISDSRMTVEKFEELSASLYKDFCLKKLLK